MNVKSKWGLVALVTVSVAFGCGSGPTVARGQSPAYCPPETAAQGAVGADGLPVAAYGPLIGAAPGYGQAHKGHHPHPYQHDFIHHYSPYRDHRFGYTGGYYVGPGGYYGGLHAGQPGYPVGHHHHGYHAGPGGKMFPYHYTTVEHDWPDDLVYPPPVQPAAMVQYPYYTLRGPSDFFMK